MCAFSSKNVRTSRGKARCDSLIRCHAAAILQHKRVVEGEEMAGERVKETELRTWLSHYVHLFALWVLLIGVGFTATYFARNGDEPADYAYLLFLASLGVVLLDQLWKIES